MKIGLTCCDCEREVDDVELYALRCHACENKQGAELARLTGENERLRAVEAAARKMARLIVDPHPPQGDWSNSLRELLRAVKAFDDAPKGE